MSFYEIKLAWKNNFKCKVGSQYSVNTKFYLQILKVTMINHVLIPNDTSHLDYFSMNHWYGRTEEWDLENNSSKVFKQKSKKWPMF